MIGIYKITNNINGKCYIGQSIDIKRRFATYRREYKISSNQAILRAMKKYGISNFTFEILLECEQEWLNYYEINIIKSLNTLSPSGYNLTTGGNYCTVSEETKKKMVKSRGKWTHTKDAKKKMSLAKLGKPSGPQSIESRCKRAKPFFIDGVYYIGTREAAKELKMSRNTIKYRLRDDNYKNYYYEEVK